jgi:hypothetical protein
MTTAIEALSSRMITKKATAIRHGRSYRDASGGVGTGHEFDQTISNDNDVVLLVWEQIS